MRRCREQEVRLHVIQRDEREKGAPTGALFYGQVLEFVAENWLPGNAPGSMAMGLL